MNKLDFVIALNKELSHLPQNEVEERLRFYVEIIEDRMEEGIPEEEAVAAVGSLEEIVAQIKAEVAPAKIVKEKQKKQRKGWLILLLILGSPVWVSLLITAFVVALSIYVSLWSVIGSLWAVFGSVAVCGVVGLVSGAVFALCGKWTTGLAVLGASAVCLGLAIFLFFGCRALTDGMVWLTGKIFQRRKKEEA